MDKKNNSLEKEFLFDNFQKALDFVNSVAKIAEKLNHHPDIFIYSYNKVRFTLSTHSENMVTEKDYELAGKIDDLLYCK